jgi:hypothetical protein
VDVHPVADGEHDVHVRIRHDGDAAVDARVRIETPVPATHPHWLIPGLFYGDNRDPACLRLYPRYSPGESDADSLTADHWAFRADRAATPAVFGWGPIGGVALEVDADTPLGLSGVGLGAGPDHPASIWVSLPYREEPFSYVGEPRGVRPLAESHRWEPGEAHELRVGLWSLPADRTSYAPVLRRLRSRERAAMPPVEPWVDIAEAAELTAYGLWRWHYRRIPRC